MNDWHVYMLQCADGSLYIGITTDLNRRVSEHNQDSKKAAAYTLSRRPVTLVYDEYCADRAEASRREYEIKQMNRTDKETLIQIRTKSEFG